MLNLVILTWSYVRHCQNCNVSRMPNWSAILESRDTHYPYSSMSFTHLQTGTQEKQHFFPFHKSFPSNIQLTTFRIIFWLVQQIDFFVSFSFSFPQVNTAHVFPFWRIMGIFWIFPNYTVKYCTSFLFRVSFFLNVKVSFGAFLKSTL